ncbi:phospholipase domain-containing protein [Streptomyces sp. NPDC006510]|uniref:phospholipase domain-containing protein n=1 Tax=Streptomyces sp. NPDC006510 TaxID=3155600 RepID=UPI0033BF8269
MGRRRAGPRHRRGHLHPHQRGKRGLPLHGVPQHRQAVRRNTAHRCAAEHRHYEWDAVRTGGRYDFTVHGADGFVCRFARTVTAPDRNDAAAPQVTAVLRGSKPENASVALLLANEGGTAVRFTVTPNDPGRVKLTRLVGPREKVSLTWPTDGGRYDMTVTADGDTGFVRRYAGTVHAIPDVTPDSWISEVIGPGPALMKDP